jgi:hypothetical protein
VNDSLVPVPFGISGWAGRRGHGAVNVEVGPSLHTEESLSLEDCKFGMECGS